MSKQLKAEIGTYVPLEPDNRELEIVLPSNPLKGDWVKFIDIIRTSPESFTNFRILRNGSLIETLSEDFIIDLPNFYLEFIYTNRQFGWKIIDLSKG